MDKVIMVPLTKLQIEHLKSCKALFDDSKDMDEVAEYLTPIFDHLDKCLADNSGWKVGDACLHEFKTCVVKIVDKDFGVQTLSDGMVETCLTHLEERISPHFEERMFPITLRGLAITRVFSRYRDKWHREYKMTKHWPDLNSWICLLYNKAMRTEEGASLKTVFKELYEMKKYLTEKEMTDDILMCDTC